MGIFKRLCMLIYALTGIFFFGSLLAASYDATSTYALYVFRLSFVQQLMKIAPFIIVFGCVIMLLRAIFTRNRKVVIISKAKDNKITVSLHAIESQAKHVIEEDGRFCVVRLYVKSAKYGHIRVNARIQPEETEDLLTASDELKSKLYAGLSVIVGNHIDAVNLEFAQAKNYVSVSDEDLVAPVSTEPLSNVTDTDVDSTDVPHTLDGADTFTVSADVKRPIHTKLLHKSSGITVPISHYGTADTASNSDDVPSQNFDSKSSRDQARKSTTIVSQSATVTSHPTTGLQTSNDDCAAVSSSSLTMSVQRERQ
ncbi:alkaline shock response membrane anchor protein AmaP [Fannyhessea vaginae]|uniref:alkaline shock response membrane anchor protein AmaP n=1 Tax=Fannyhessea vaginae TaxID=82135 RepID=UPI0023EFDFA4|nr:alkaline shock response membrane anchor protein AmaP [Fannyhessea vaginae]